jgi:hypothetical protein
MSPILRACSVCGRRAMAGESRCHDHRLAKRPKTKARGYGGQHQRIRRMWGRRVALGDVVCARCGEFIAPDEPWDLGHDDNDRSLYNGPEHQACNRGARPERITSREW